MKSGKVVAVIPAAGSGQRMGTAIPKQFLAFGDVPLLLYSLQAFERYGIKKVIKIVAGGATRQESVYHGLKETDPEAEIVVIHDAVRPFVTEDLIERLVEA